MIELIPGLRLVLPSGNVVRLVQREGEEWLCEYTELARARGEVWFTIAFLQLHAVVFAVC